MEITAAQGRSAPLGRYTYAAADATPRDRQSRRHICHASGTISSSEQVLWIERFDTLDELRARIRQFARDFNDHWLLERHGYRTPAQARQTLRQTAMT